MNETRDQIEQAAICCVLHDPEAALAVAINAGCVAEWFDNDNRRRIWQAIEARHAQAKPCDYLSLCQHLRGDPVLLAEMDAAEELAIIPAYTPHYVDCLRGHWTHCQALELARRQLRALESANPSDATVEYDSIRESWQTLGHTQADTDTLGDIARAKVEEWRKPMDQRPARVTWPLAVLNRHIGALTNELVYISAKESVGKTAIALQFLIHNGAMNMHGALASLESSRARLVPRLLSQISGQNTLEADRGHASPEILDLISVAADKVDGLGFDVCDRPMSIEQLHAWAKMCKAKGATYIIVDNTRHIRLRQSFSGPGEKFSFISERLKWIRDDIDIPVIALHHSKKEGDDVSWSQDLRRDVDVLLLMNRNMDRSIAPTSANGWRSEDWVDVAVSKNRDARAGMTIGLRFVKEQQRFEGD